MMKCDVRTDSDLIAYVLDCNLATVISMAMKKSRAVNEYMRQIGIAQFMLDHCVSKGICVKGTRAEEICAKCGSRVINWAKIYEVKK